METIKRGREREEEIQSILISKEKTKQAGNVLRTWAEAL